jgi:regulatory protein
MTGGDRTGQVPALRQAQQPVEGLAPVIPLFGGAVAAPSVTAPPTQAAPGEERRRPVTFSEEYWAEDESIADESAAAVADDADDAGRFEEPTDREALCEKATTSLIRSLGRRGLSIAESKTRLRREGLTDDEATSVIDDIVDRGWLDDAVLAEQIVHSATDRKGMGTRAIRQLLVKRSIARDVIDEVIADLPDDDAERAMEFARTKARALVQYDDDVAMRRLMGMLARRGFGGSVASKTARAALEDERRSAGGSGVRFR